ncbi:MAG: ORF6N domain-containing protein [Chitinophagales bacterium]|nr:ORF6N domain-containing protein [Chitinophagales bacterium]
MQLQLIQKRIFEIRGTRVMLDSHLAELYQVPTKVLKQAVRRNLKRFPKDFMFQLTRAEYNALRSQIVTLKHTDSARGQHSKYLPFAFTEQGVAMLSTVLKSEKAIKINIAVMRAFVLIRQHHADYKELKEKIEAVEKEMNVKFEDVHQALNYLVSPQGQRPVIKGYRKED